MCMCGVRCIGRKRMCTCRKRVREREKDSREEEQDGLSFCRSDQGISRVITLGW